MGYSPANDTWEPRSTLAQVVPDVVEDYEARRKTATATDGVGSVPDLVSHNTREQRSYNEQRSFDELLSDSETYYEDREHG